MATKKDLLQQEVAQAVGAGKAVGLETVDFNDPNRPKTWRYSPIISIGNKECEKDNPSPIELDSYEQFTLLVRIYRLVAIFDFMGFDEI